MDHLLSLVIFLPLLGAIGCFVASPGGARAIALATSALTFLVSLPLWSGYDPAGPAFQFVEEAPWIPEWGIAWAVGIDGISLLLVLLTTFLTPLVVLSATPAIQDRVGSYLGWMLVLETAMLGTFAALDTFLFYVFWEAMLVPMYFIIGIWGGPRRLYATLKFFIYTMAGSVLMLVAILVLYRLHHEATGTWSARLEDLEALTILPGLQHLLFAAFALAFAIKVPMFPVHTWLPDAHVEAPTGGSVILAGVLLKMGTYGFLRFALPLLPEAALAWAPWMAALAVVGIVYGALVAMVQDDIKKLVAYSSVSHLGYVMLGLFAFNVEGVSGAVFQMINHGLSTGALFLLVGVLYERRHTRAIAEYGGIARVVPGFAFVLMVVVFSSAGLPGLNGFVGEFLILLGSFASSPWLTAFAATGVVFGAVYLLWMVQRVMFGPLTNPANRDLPDLTRREVGYLLPILALVVLLGVMPGPFLSVMEPSVQRVVDRVEQVRAPTVAHAEEVAR